ncbi:imidazoleglycerol-phosphate dehydratase HisB [bacterium]|nr:imidazoleglycerol-phosphate dehydratase HisB [bacterium]
MKNEKQSYEPPQFTGEIKLSLNRNESVSALPDLTDTLASISSDNISRYPSYRALQNAIGDWIGVDSNRVVVTSGGDEGIDRVIRSSLSLDRDRVVTHSPSFEMFDIYTHNAGGNIKKVDWLKGEFPLEDFINQLDSETALAVIVSPNNPTGLQLSVEQITAIADRCRQVGCKLLVDCAYIEFADYDPTPELYNLDDVILVRTFSKAWGLAGLRVGYLIASNEDQAAELRSIAGPFPVSGCSLELAYRALTTASDQMAQNVESIRQFRNQVTLLIEECGGNAWSSQGNFVFAKFKNAEAIWLALAKQGVEVRKFHAASLNDHLRITVPVSVASMMHLTRAMANATNSGFDISTIVGQEDLSAPTGPLKGACPARISELDRKTKETDISIQLNLDGAGTISISTGIGFLDHMLTAFAFHSRMDLELKCVGDLHIDDHHTAEDCALALGTAIDMALGPRKGIKRFGYAYAPLDEALARTVLDLSGRPWPEVHLNLNRENIGTIASENLTHFFQSLAMTLKCSLHVDVLRGTNDHHKAEAAFKSLALAFKSAIAPSGNDVPSTKGVI